MRHHVRGSWVVRGRPPGFGYHVVLRAERIRDHVDLARRGPGELEEAHGVCHEARDTVCADLLRSTMQWESRIASLGFTGEDAGWTLCAPSCSLRRWTPWCGCGFQFILKASVLVPVDDDLAVGVLGGHQRLAAGMAGR